MLPPFRLTVRLNATGTHRVPAFAARSAGGRPVKRTSGVAPADMNGTHSTPEECAPRASISGLRPSAFPAPDGRYIRSGMRSDSALHPTPNL